FRESESVKRPRGQAPLRNWSDRDHFDHPRPGEWRPSGGWPVIDRRLSPYPMLPAGRHWPDGAISGRPCLIRSRRTGRLRSRAAPIRGGEIMTGSLDGITVLSLEQAVAAPFCTARLADAGARVIKVEREEGDFARGYDAAVHGESSYFVWLNRGKQSLVADLKQPEDRALVDR